MKKQKEGRRSRRAIYKVGPRPEGTQEVARFALMGDKRSQQIESGYVSSDQRTNLISPREKFRGLINVVHSYGSVFHALVPGRTSVWRFASEKIKAAKGPSYGSVFHALVPGRKSVLLWLLTSVFVLALSLSHLTPSTPAYAAINEQLNFQARLLNSSGGLVPDGFYNVQFNIYSGGDGDPSTADESLEWTGTHQNDNTDGVRVVNGYLSVQLGSSVSQTNTLADVDWNDSTLWLSINIGNTGSGSSCATEANFNSNCGGDGEMDPFMRLTSVPYAFNANRLDNLDSTDFVQLGQGTQTDSSNNTSIAINKTGSGDILTLQDGGTTELLFNQNGELTLGSASDNGQLILSDGSSNTGTFVTTALSSDRTYTFPDASGTVALNTSGSATAGVSAFVQGGNTWAATGTLGLTDNNTLNIITNNTTRISISGAGSTTITGGTSGDALTVNNSTSTGNIFVAQDNGTPVFTIADGGIVSVNNGVLNLGSVSSVGILNLYDTFENTISIRTDVVSDFGGNRVIEIPVIGADDTFCLETLANCGSSTDMWTDGGAFLYTTSGEDVVLGGTSTANADIWLQATGAAIFNEQGAAVDFRVESDNTTGIISVTGSTDTISLGSANGAAATTLLSGTGDITLTSTDDIVINGGGANAAINIGTVATAHTIVIGNETGATSLELDSGTGAINIGNAIAKTINIGNATGATLVNIDSGTGGVTIDSTGTGDLLFNSADTVLIDAAGVLELNSSAGVISIGNDAVAQNINIGTGAAARTITIGNATGATSLVLNAGTGNIDIGTTAQARLTNIATGAAAQTVTLGSTNTTSTLNLQSGSGLINLNTTQAQFTEVTGTRTLTAQTRTTNVAGTNLTVQAGTAGAGGSAFSGGLLTLQGGSAGGTGNANGGNVNLVGGLGTGTGVKGLVVIDTPTMLTASTQNCTGTPCAITQANVDSYGAVVITTNATGYTVTLGDPTQGAAAAGRLIYVTNADATDDFTLSANAGGELITLKPNTTATMIWNGSDWTAAGASSSTDLQAAYDNTATSAGGAELVLNAPGGNADGLTIRNNATTPISGGIFEVQSSIGTNLFSVNNLGTELAANGGSENSGTWATNWTTITGATVARTTTGGEFVTGLAGAEVTTSTSADSGIRNNLSGNPVVSTTYTVSFTARLASGTFSTLQVAYSRDGGTDFELCTNYSTQTLSTSVWTKITCTITTDGTSPSNPDLVIRQTDAGTARNFWIDNLSFIRNDSSTQPSNVQIGGGITGGQVTLFTLDRASAPPVADGDTTYLGSMYYDTTSGRIQCYESDGWGACGSPPNNIITLTPEYAGSVLNGTGVGTMTADFCADQGGVLTINATLCGTGEAVNFYAWTSPQASFQTYSIYLTYQLPETFRQFMGDDTITLDAYTTDTDDAMVNYEIYRSTGSTITECGDAEDVTDSDNIWQTVAHGGNEQTVCDFAGGDRVIFKLNMTARNNDTVYVSDINFTYTNE